MNYHRSVGQVKSAPEGEKVPLRLHLMGEKAICPLPRNRVWAKVR